MESKNQGEIGLKLKNEGLLKAGTAKVKALKKIKPKKQPGASMRFQDEEPSSSNEIERALEAEMFAHSKKQQKIRKKKLKQTANINRTNQRTMSVINEDSQEHYEDN